MTSAITPPSGDAKLEAARLRSVDLTGPAGRLEALLNEGAADAPYAAVVCHPNPKAGGTMHNKVVYHAMKVLNDPEFGLGWPVLRFNFRGTGLSHGTFDGRAEAGDVLAAMDWLENAYKRPLVVLGFSFGSAMALMACCKETRHPSRVRGVAALGLPTEADGHRYRYPFLASSPISKFFLSGDNDLYAPGAQLAEVVGSAADPKRLVLIPGADHFFTGHLERMQRELASWLKEL